MEQAIAQEQRVDLDKLGERLGALRLCESGAVSHMRLSLARHGQLQAITVQGERDRLEVVDGFKRLRAARELGWPSLRAQVLELDEAHAKAALWQLNAGRGLTELEEAWLCRSLYREDRLTQPEIGRLFSRHKSWVCRRLLLAEGLDEAVQADVRLGLVSPSAAAALGRLPRCNQRAAAQVVTRTGMTFGQTARLVADVLASDGEKARAALLRDRLEHPAPPAGPTPPRRDRTAAQWMMGDIAALLRIAARLQARLLGAPLLALGDRPAALVTDALLGLRPVIATLERQIRRVTRKEETDVDMEYPRGAGPGVRRARPGRGT